MSLTLVIGSKDRSSWSLRPWLALKQIGVPFKEILIPLGQPDTKAQVLEYSPSGKIPLLIDGEITVWESLAILDHLADRFPGRGLWPDDPVARGLARAISAAPGAAAVGWKVRWSTSVQPADRTRTAAKRVAWDDI